MTLIGRKFLHAGDVDEAVALVGRSRGLQRTRQLAQVHCEKAIEAIGVLGESEARASLIALACKVITRSK